MTATVHKIYDDPPERRRFNKISKYRGKRTGDPLCAALAQRRVELGLSRNALAARIGYDIAGITRWETGENMPTLRHFIDWAGGLGLRVILEEI